MKRVLVPLDGSPQSEAALKEAFEVFPEADFHVLHVLQVTKPSGTETKSGYELAVDDAEEILEAAETIAGEHGRNIKARMTEGNAAKAIVSYAEKNGIDHIVMGSIGRSGVSRLLLGSVAESVTRRAPCSVMVVRES